MSQRSTLAACPQVPPQAPPRPAAAAVDARGLKAAKLRAVLVDEPPARVGAIPCYLEHPHPHSPLPLTRGGSTEAGLKGRLQEALKRHGRWYYRLVGLLGPTWHDGRLRRRRRELLARYGPGDVILNLGSGPQRYAGRADIINVDLFPFQEVDLLADARDLPIAAGSADLIINVAMLEHTPEPERVVEQMHRVLKPGGRLLCFVPFAVPYHAAPHDYHRWTISGTRRLFGSFQQVEIVACPGPTSSLLWMTQEWLATLLSLGWAPLHDAVLLALMLVTFPVKFLDEVLARLPNAHRAALGFYVFASK